MHRKKLSEKAIPYLFDAIVWGGFAAFLFAAYIAGTSFLDKFPGPISKLLNVIQSLFA